MSEIVSGSFEAPFKTPRSPTIFTFSSRISDEPEVSLEQARERVNRWSDWAQLILKNQPTDLLGVSP